MPDFTETRIQFRRGTASEWVASNPVLDSSEPGYDTTNKVFKIGNGSTAWSGLPNMVMSNTSGIAGASGITNVVQISQANFNSLGSYSPNTAYLIVG